LITANLDEWFRMGVKESQLGTMPRGSRRKGAVKIELRKADLHIHTTHSDGTASVPKLLQHVAAHTELRIIAVTDHDTITGAKEAYRLAREFGIEVVIGEEVSTAEGHLLALFIDSYLPPGRPVAETIAAVHAQGGLCVAAHPFDQGIPSLGAAGLLDHCTGARSGAWPLDAIESFNAGVFWPRRACNGVAQRMADERKIPGVGGSDAHSLMTVGSGYTLFRGNSANDLYQAILQNQVAWGGTCWNFQHYLNIGWLYFRQRTLRGAIKLLRSDGAIPLQP